MAEDSEELLLISLQLRFALFGLECAFGVSFDGVECERIFRDAADDQISAKHYVLFDSPRLVVRGRVEDCESDSIWLQIHGRRGSAEILRRVVEGSEFHALRLRKSLENDKLTDSPNSKQ